MAYRRRPSYSPLAIFGRCCHSRSSHSGGSTGAATGSIVGAGAVCREGMVVPPNSLVLGVPGRIVRETTDDERTRIARTVASYLALQVEHREGRYPGPSSD